MLSCGEPSGDLYAGALTTELRQLDSAVDVFGLGGGHLAEAGGRLTVNYAGLAATGFTEALSVLPRSLIAYRRLVAAARAERPDVFVAIDFPEVNFRLGAALRKLGIPTVYYICPQVWAWRRGRLRKMKEFVTRALVIFPFEEALYRNWDIPVRFVGHPLLDLVAVSPGREAFRREQGLDPAAPVVALLPGSRANEVRLILPDLVEAARHMLRDIPAVKFLVARAPNLEDELFWPVRMLERETACQVRLVASRTDDVLEASDVVLTASGTATIQTAIHERPMVVVYRLAPLTYRLCRRFVQVDAFGMVNLVAQRKVVPELLQDEFTPEAVARVATRFLTDQEHAASTRANLRAVRDALGGRGASRRAATQVMDVVNSRSDI